MKKFGSFLSVLLTAAVCATGVAGQERSGLRGDRLTVDGYVAPAEATDVRASIRRVDAAAAPSLDGEISVGTGQTYTSLTNAGGAFEALNTGGATSNITFNITSDLTAETGAVALNEVAGGFTVTIKPSGGARVINGTSAASSAIIILNGADNVTIDGSLSGGTDKSLTVSNATTTSVAIWLRSAGTSNGASNNTIKNVNIQGSAASNIIAGVIAGSSTFGSPAEAPNNNNKITNNKLIKAQNAIYAFGGATTFDQNWVISGNEIGSTVAAEKMNFRGLLLANAQNFTIANNSITGVISTTTSTATMHGIQLAGAMNGGVVSGNRIREVKQINTGGWGAAGITLGQTGTASAVAVYNNFINEVTGAGFNGVGVGDNGYGIVVSAGGGYSVWYNSVSLPVNQTAAGSITAAVNITSAVTGTGAVDLRNNILSSTQTVGNPFAVINNGTAGAGVFSAINNNDYVAANIGRVGTTVHATLAAWQTYTGGDAASVSVDPMFVSTTDNHLQASSPVLNLATPIATVTTDIDGDARSATTPDIGADEIGGTAPANASLSGRAVTASGRGVAGAHVRATGATQTWTAVTGPFGYFKFDSLPTGTYTVTINSKRYTFTTSSTSVTLNTNTTMPDFVTNP
mgnify:CR=1 FL=1